MVVIWWQIIDVTFSKSVKERCHRNQFSGKNQQNRPIHLHSSFSHSETDSSIAFPISIGSIAIISLYYV